MLLHVRSPQRQPFRCDAALVPGQRRLRGHQVRVSAPRGPVHGTSPRNSSHVRARRRCSSCAPRPPPQPRSASAGRRRAIAYLSGRAFHLRQLFERQPRVHARTIASTSASCAASPPPPPSAAPHAATSTGQRFGATAPRPRSPVFLEHARMQRRSHISNCSYPQVQRSSPRQLIRARQVGTGRTPRIPVPNRMGPLRRHRRGEHARCS